MDKFKEKNLLSLRERQALHMLTQGDKYSQISHSLNISTNTVKFHVKNTKHKIQAWDTNHVTHIANRNEITQMRIDILVRHTNFSHQISRDNFPYYLDEEEIKRYDRFHFVSDKELYILGRILLRTTLKRCQPDASLQSWQFSTCRYGRPSTVSPQLARKISFSLSYTVGTTAVAISSHCKPGIDIEQIGDLGNSYLNISQYFFILQEATNIVSLPRCEGQLLFWKVWMLKEAYIRYRGKGLSSGLNCTELHLTDKKLTSKYRGSPVYFSQWKICDSFLALTSPLTISRVTTELFPVQPQFYHHDYQPVHSSNGQN